KDAKKYNYLISEVPNYILIITMPITVLVICMAPNIMYLLGGTEFIEAYPLLQLIAITILLSPISNYLQNQVLVASGKEKVGLYCSIITSVISLGLNIILIPKIGLLGAGIVQVISEFTAVVIRY